eukprot:scaffold243256_cov25-Prasinocladus_malaysianus.AAC.2
MTTSYRTPRATTPPPRHPLAATPKHPLMASNSCLIRHATRSRINALGSSTSKPSARFTSP